MSIYDDDCRSQTQVFTLCKKFLEGRETDQLLKANVVDDYQQHCLLKLMLTLREH